MAARMPRRRRAATAVFVALIGLIVAAGCAVLGIYASINGRPFVVNADAVSAWARDTRFGELIGLVVGIVVAAIGVLLLLAAIVPARRGLVELTQDDQDIAAGLAVRSLDRTLAAAARSVDGISVAKVSGRRRLKVTAATPLRNTDGLADRVERAVTTRLDALSPRVRPAVRVRLRKTDA